MMLLEGILKAGVCKTLKDIQLRLSQYRNNDVSKLKFRLHCKYLMSWQALRIYIEATNFYDHTTALNLLDFNIFQVVNMLLM